MSPPQTKGVLLAPVVADVLRLILEGRISRDDLEDELSTETLKALDNGISPVSWYSHEVYRDLARVLMKVEGRGLQDMEYLRKRGERAGQRLVESGLYQQLDFMQRSIEARRQSGRIERAEFERSLRFIVSMPAALMKGGAWSVAQDPDHPDRVQIVVADVEGFPEESAQAVCGILTGITVHGGSRFSWRYERPAPDRIVYRMDRDIARLGG